MKKKGQPWEIAKAFDHSAPVGKFVDKTLVPLADIHFQLFKNNQLVQDGHTRDLIFDFNYLIVNISQYFTLLTGDYIFTGTPAGVGPVAIGDVLEGYLEGEKVLEVEVK